MVRNTLTFFTVLILVSACSSIQAVGPGTYAPNNAYEVTLGKTWSAYLPNRRTKSRLLTIDGSRLNALTFVASIEDGDAILQTSIRDREKLVPKFRAGMGDFEIAEFLTDSLTAIGMVNLESSNMRPDTFGSLEGIRFEFEGSAASGLNYAGMAKAAVQGETLHLIFYYAPAEHYYGLHADEVDAIMNSVTLRARS